MKRSWKKETKRRNERNKTDTKINGLAIYLDRG